MNYYTKTGIYHDAELSFFDRQELDILDMFSKEWYITITKEIFVAKSRYKILMMKPTIQYTEMFNLEREIVVVFSPYSVFEPRSVDAIDEATQKFSLSIQDLRIEEICSVIISKDILVEEKIGNLLMNDKESKVVIPFSYSELLKNSYSSFFIQNRFRKHFYNRDLFGFRSAIQKETYFFGRKDLVQELVNTHLSGECGGIFGLRKTGKTSIIFSIGRTLKAKEVPFILIDCQDTAVYKKRWNKLLYYITSKLASKYNIKLQSNIDNYTEDEASEFFSRDIRYIYGKVGKKRILVMFDEIERISFKVSDEEHWQNGADFIAFWRTLRAVFQESKDCFTYLIAGTNAMCVEERAIGKIENPIYNQIKAQYIPQFSVKQVSQMLQKLGGYMGLNFDDIVCSNLTQDYGGHPFLIRQVCSVISETVKDHERPVAINRIEYDKAKPKFDEKYGYQYSAMILDVLKDFYDLEYLMLKHLALGDLDFFNEHALSDDAHFYTNHLIEYGVLYKKGNSYDFRIDTLKEYLIEKSRFEKKALSNEEKLAEISARRNQLEPRLRKIARNALLSKFDESAAKNIAIKKLHKNENKFLTYAYKDLFNPNKSEDIEVYLSKLTDLMYSYWDDCYRNIFEKDKEKFKARMLIINELRADAHAKDVKNYDMDSFRGAIGWLEEKIDDYES